MKAVVLTLTLLTSLLSCQTSTSNNQQDGAQVKPLAQQDLQSTMAGENVVVIDVRTPGEVAQGHIKGAHMFIDFYSDGFQSEVLKLDKSKTYIMYCRSGGRSGQAANFMVQNGFTNVYNLQGGIGSYSGPIEK